MPRGPSRRSLCQPPAAGSPRRGRNPPARAPKTFIFHRFSSIFIVFPLVSLALCTFSSIFNPYVHPFSSISLTESHPKGGNQWLLGHLVDDLLSHRQALLGGAQSLVVLCQELLHQIRLRFFHDRLPSSRHLKKIGGKRLKSSEFLLNLKQEIDRNREK